MSLVGTVATVRERHGQLEGADVIPSHVLADWWATQPCGHLYRRALSALWAVCRQCGARVRREP